MGFVFCCFLFLKRNDVFEKDLLTFQDTEALQWGLFSSQKVPRGLGKVGGVVVEQTDTCPLPKNNVDFLQTGPGSPH